MDRRTAIAIVAFAALMPPPNLGAQRSRRPDSTTVVFVCEHGSVKSLVAMQYFNAVARARGLPVRAISRGTTPDPAVPVAIREGLRRDGFDVSLFRPRLFGATDVKGAVLVVSFDQDVTLTVGNTVPLERWDNLPALSESYGIGRDSIRARVDLLFARMTGKP